MRIKNSINCKSINKANIRNYNQKFHFGKQVKKDTFEHSQKQDNNVHKTIMKKFPVVLATTLLLNGCCVQKQGDLAKIGDSIVDIDDFSYRYIETYKNQTANQELDSVAKKAYGYNAIPIIGGILYNLKGTDEIRDTLAEQDGTINGYLDDNIAQGLVSDCWLITALQALSYTPTGAQYIHDSISQDKNGDIDVYFKGPDLTYKVKMDDIDLNNGKYTIYSRGDDDLLVIEMACEQYRKDLKDGKIEKQEGLPEYVYDTNKSDSSPLDLGETRQAYWLMTGIVNSIEARSEEEIKEVLDRYKNDKQNSLLDVELSKDCKIKDVDGNKHKMYGSHGYCVKDIDDKVITLVCATYSQEIIKINIDDLQKMPIDVLVYANLNDG